MSTSLSSLSFPSTIRSHGESVVARVAYTPELLSMILETLEQPKNKEVLLQCRLVNRFFTEVVSRILLVSVLSSAEDSTSQQLSHCQLTFADIAGLQAKANEVTNLTIDLMSIFGTQESWHPFRTLKYPSLRSLSIKGRNWMGFQRPPKEVWERLLPNHLAGLRIDWLDVHEYYHDNNDYNPTNDIVQVMMKHCPAIIVCSMEWSALSDMSDELWAEFLNYLEKTSVQRLNFSKANSGMLYGRVENLVSVLARNDFLTHLTISSAYHYDGLIADMANEHRRPFASLSHLHLDIRQTYLPIFTRFISLASNVQHLYLTIKAHGWDNIERLRPLTNLRSLHLFVHSAPVVDEEIAGHARLLLNYLQRLSTLRTLEVISRCQRDKFYSSFLPLMQQDLQSQQKLNNVWPNIDRIFLHCRSGPPSLQFSDRSSGDVDVWKKKHDGIFDYQQQSKVEYVPEEHYNI